MKVIYKYDVSPERFSHNLPTDAQILSVQVQRGEVKMWVLLDDDLSRVERTSLCLGTGHATSFPLTKEDYIGTFQLSGGYLVFHLFEITRFL